MLNLKTFTMKHLTIICALAILMASCSNGSSGPQTTTDTTTNTTIDTTQQPVTTNPEDMATDGAEDTNGHILENGKVRTGNDKVKNGDVKKADTNK